MSTTCLVDHDAQRSRRFRVVGACEQELSAADDHRQRIVELVARPRGKFAQGIELALLPAAPLRFRSPGGTAATTDASRRSRIARSRTMAAQAPQALLAVSEASRSPHLGQVSMAPELDISAGAPVNFERNDESGGRARSWQAPARAARLDHRAAERRRLPSAVGVRRRIDPDHAALG